MPLNRPSSLRLESHWSVQMIIKLLYTLPLLVLAQAAINNDAVGQPTGIVPGQISQLPPAPAPQKIIPNIRIQRRGATRENGPVGPSVLVNALHITGQTRFSESQLIVVTGYTQGQSLNLSDLRRMAVLITDYYNARGYMVAQAYVPAQEIRDGGVTIVVIEGRYGAVKLDNRSRVRSGVAQGVLKGLNSGDIVAAAPLERRLLLLSDIPGVGARSTLSPGSEVGTSNLQVDLTPGPLVTGDVEADNYGNPYTGAYQGGGTVNINEPFGIGDVASVRALTSGDGMQYVRGSYQAQLGDATVGAAYAYFHYRLGRQFSSLKADGWQQVASVYASYPLIRSYNDNLHVLIDADHRTFQDRIGFASTVTEKQAGVAILGLAGDHHDAIGGGGWDAYAIYVSVGDLDIETPLARASDAATARTQGEYEKLGFSFDRLQTVSGPFAIYVAVKGQVASKNLDISEKMELGGAYAVRAYPEGEAYGDEGYVATVEGRLWLPRVVGLPGRFQLVGFFDTGWVRFSKTPWFAGPNTATRSGAGVGLTWVDNNNFVARVSYAHMVGSATATSLPNSSGQFWFELVKYF
jgi:hemolysin activation/secretion protein